LARPPQAAFILPIMPAIFQPAGLPQLSIPADFRPDPGYRQNNQNRSNSTGHGGHYGARCIWAAEDRLFGEEVRHDAGPKTAQLI
jgi:hypothetical protein